MMSEDNEKTTEDLKAEEQETVDTSATEEEINEEIDVEEDEMDDGTQWTEEFVVAGSEIVDAVKRLIHEAGVRRIVVKNDEKRIHLELPLWIGVAGIALLPFYAALAVIAALLVDCTILVERDVPKEKEAAADEMAEDVA